MQPPSLEQRPGERPGERRRASIVEALQSGGGQSTGPLTVDRVWAAAALVLENIYVELNKRLEQLQESLEAKVIGPASPTGDAMVAYNKARVQFQADCAKVLAKFNSDFGEAKLKYEKELAKSGGREASTAALHRVFDKYARKVAGLQSGMAELVAKGNSVLDTPQLSITLLRYWAEHDRVMRQVYNSLIDLDSSTRGCTMDMSHEIQHITAFAEMLRQESAGCFNAAGQFELGGGYGLPPKQLQVDEPTFSQPPQPKKVPHSMLSFAEESLAAAGATLQEGGGDTEPAGPDAPQWSGGVSDRVLEGQLKKKSPAAGKGWQTRWFVLHGSSPARLSYFKRRTDDEPAGYINLELLAACFATTELKHDGKGIKLMMLDQRTYYLKASTPQDAQTWVTAISQAAARSSAVDGGGGGGGHGDDGELDGPDAADAPEPGSNDEESSSSEEEDDSLVPADEVPGGIGEEELQALRAEEAALSEANERLQAEVAQLETELHGLL
jgi:flagellar hook-basal body complex protein FliE